MTSWEFAANRRPCPHGPSASAVRRPGSACSRLSRSSARPISRPIAARALRPRKPSRREAQGARYMFELNSRWAIDGSVRWNVARYLNHSCWPNAKPVSRKGKIIFVALRLIAPGEEITYDYGREYFDYFLRSGGCRCAACRIKTSRSPVEEKGRPQSGLARQQLRPLPATGLMDAAKFGVCGWPTHQGGLPWQKGSGRHDADLSRR